MTPDATIDRPFLSVTEAGALLGVQRGRAYALASQGVFPTVRVGGRIRVPREAFSAWLEAQSIAALAGTVDTTRRRA